MNRHHQTTNTNVAHSKHRTKYLRVIPKKMALQAVVVAVATGALLMDSKYVSRRMASRDES